MDPKLEFSHIKNDDPAMVDVSPKAATLREAWARSSLRMPSWVTDRLDGGHTTTKKGPVFHTAIIAGIMAVKRTHSLIPLCHSINIEDIRLFITIPSPGTVRIECGVKSFGRTGVEMEALTGASIAALTVYDMCKSLSFDMQITKTRLLRKTGGKRDHVG